MVAFALLVVLVIALIIVLSRRNCDGFGILPSRKAIGREGMKLPSVDDL